MKVFFWGFEKKQKYHPYSPFQSEIIPKHKLWVLKKIILVVLKLFPSRMQSNTT